MTKDEGTNICFTFYDNQNRYKGYEYYKAKLVPLKRKSIYGERRVIPLDANNEECNRVFYDELDMTLYPKKAIGLCKLNEDGTLYSEKEQAAEAQKNKKQDTDKSQNLFKELQLKEMSPNSASFYLSYEVDKVYTLNGYDSTTIANIIGEKLFEVGGCSCFCSSWMFQRNGTVFLLIRKKENEGDYAEKNMGYQIDDEPLISDITELDDIDFAMF